MPNPNFEKQVEELGANLTKIGDQIKAAAEETNKQIKASGEMYAETRDKVDKLLLEQGSIQARLQEAEQKLLKGACNWFWCWFSSSRSYGWHYWWSRAPLNHS